MLESFSIFDKIVEIIFCKVFALTEMPQTKSQDFVMRLCGNNIFCLKNNSKRPAVELRVTERAQVSAFENLIIY